jgi:squalene synthase HpnC
LLAGENFPVALRILPGAIRAHLLALYAYARFVDDLGDEPTVDGHDESPSDRLAAMRWFACEVRDLYDGRPPRHPVLVRLAPTVAACQLPINPLLRLIAANERDQEVTRYPSYDDLVDYCHLSANPVGELVLQLFDAASPERIELSNRICTALQVIEHLQDVAEDRRRGRIYLPADDLDAYGVRVEELDARHASVPLREVIRLQAERAAAALDDGAPLVGSLKGWARVAVAGYVAGGRAALAALARSGYDPLPGPPRPSRAEIAVRWLKLMLVRIG